MASRGRTKESRAKEYAKTKAKQQVEAERLGYRSVYQMKQEARAVRILQNKRSGKSQGKSYEEQVRKHGRAHVLEAYRKAFVSKDTGFPGLTKASQPLPMGVKEWYVDYLEIYTPEEWDELYGRPT